MLKAFCDNRECFYYGAVECKAKEIWHTSEGFCTAYKPKQEAEYKQMMRYGPIDFKRCERDVGD